MNRAISLSALGVLLLASGEARPCGGAFGNTVTIDPIQKIVVSYKNGVETYILNPYFCGNSDSFGLILPVPATLTQNPTLGQTQLYTDIGTVSAPIIQTHTACMSKGTGGSASAYGGSSSVGGSGTTVINRGQVGIFDWVLLQATSATAFSDWLTANGFPYQPTAQTAFNYYVSAGWYFVAFKVSTGNSGSGTGGAGTGGAGTGGAGGKSGSTPPNTSPIGSGGTGGKTGTGTTRICGNFGPVMLSFASATQPVVPARIAAVSSNQLNWTLYTLAAQQMRLRDYPSTLRFSGALTTADMNTYSSLNPIAQEGDRLTELLLSLPSSSTTDLVLEPDPNQADYRRTEIQTVYVSCTTGGMTSTSVGTGGLVYGTGGAVYGTGGTNAASVGGTISAGGTVNNGGAADNGGTLALGGAISTGGIFATGGLLGTGGSAPTGGMRSNGGGPSNGGPSGGAPSAGGVMVVAGATGIGGTPNSGDSSTLDRQKPGQKNDDGGCSVRNSSSGSRKSGSSWLAALLGLGAFYRRRRHLRRR